MLNTANAMIFYFFAFLAVVSASLVIVSKNSVRAVLFLVLTFFSTAGIWIMLQAEFLAITLVLVYVGAVMVLFLFVVMMLDVEIAALKSRFARYLPLALCVSVLTLICLIYGIDSEIFNIALPETQKMNNSIPSHSVKNLSFLLYTQYIFPFLIAGVLLLVAIVAAIVLSFRGKRGSLSQNVEEQVSVKKWDRVRLVKMESVNSSLQPSRDIK